ncbi:MAG: response regulator [Planctomycetales bacterium]|nr:response regulator [Planctomycetales bacterium]
MRILIADDSAVLRAQLLDALASAEFDVVVAQDGEDAWNALKQGDIPLAILDWVMPKMDGLQVCERLDEQGILDSVHVILLTARGSDAEMVSAFEKGISDYVTKPFSEVELLARVRAGKRIVNLRSRLAHAQKMESVGQLAAGIAHEINTPIQYVGDNTRFLDDAFKDLDALFAAIDELTSDGEGTELSQTFVQRAREAARQADLTYLRSEVPQAIQQSLEGVARVAKIVRAMKEFSHPGSEDRTAVDLNHAIESTITVSRNEWKYCSEIETDFDDSLPLVSCYPGDLNQAILNLIVNAAHAIEEARLDDMAPLGRITLSTRLINNQVEVRVADTGGGIPSDVQPRIFDPFFTTKAVGKGTGQGLAIVYSVVVEKHGGAIEFETQSGKGTTFIVRLPISET